MKFPSNVDPFQLTHLLDDVDREFFEGLASEFPKLVDPDGFSALKQQLSSASLSIFTEVSNDRIDLVRRLQRPDLLSGNEVIPTEEMTVSELGSVMTPPIKPGEPDPNEMLPKWHAKRLTWAFSNLLRIYLRFSNDLNRLSLDERQVEEKTPGGSRLVDPLPIWNLERIYREWMLLKSATLEYLGAKSELLFSLGSTDARVGISYPDTTISDACVAFEGHESYAPFLMLQALRKRLADLFDLTGDSYAHGFEAIPTSVLIGMAYAAGLRFAVPVQTLGNVAVDLEHYSGRCSHAPLLFLCAAHTIVGKAVDGMRGIETTPDSKRKIREFINRAVSEKDGGQDRS